MNTNSNSYTIIYASIMVVIVAFLLAFVSSSLKEKQYQNVEQDTKKQILAALNVYDVKDVNAEYDKYVKEDDLMQADGSLVKNDAAFQTSYKGEIANGRLHVFVCDVDGQTKYVLPIYGAGLWGPIWGYIALNDDKDTVYGVYFSHQGETPGLGAEITTTKFQDQFLGKHVMENGTLNARYQSKASIYHEYPPPDSYPDPDFGSVRQPAVHLFAWLYLFFMFFIC